MKPIILVTVSGRPIHIFTQHIAYIEHTTKGATIHVSCGGKDVAIATGLSWKDLFGIT